MPVTPDAPSRAHNPFLVRYRTRISLVLFVLLIPAMLFNRHVYAEGSFVDLAFETVGFFLMTVGVLWRLWCTLYIGGRKNMELQVTGPYSLVRHPLYFGSLLLGLGFSALAQSWVVLLIALAYFAIQYFATIRFEESTLLALFGDTYVAYQQRVPCFLPSRRTFDPTSPASVNLKPLYDEVRNALVFLALIPLLEWVHTLQTHVMR